MNRWLKRFWAWPSELSAMGILGMNRRNAHYLLEENPREYFPLVDDKLKTKQLCHERRIPVPKTIAAISHFGDVRRLGDWLSDRTQFVIKPAHGSGGKGIVVIASYDPLNRRYLTSSGVSYSLNELQYHVSTILSGLYSLSGQSDTAILEERIEPHSAFRDVCVDGTPDIRVILYRTVPAMAMVRLPTRASRGRANLHQGAIAAGIDLLSGKTLGGVCRNQTVSRHPDKDACIAGFSIPHWNELMNAAIELSEALKLGYVGLDFVVDQSEGPLVLEANARPGLAIQIANRNGLQKRLEQIDIMLAEFDVSWVRNKAIGRTLQKPQVQSQMTLAIPSVHDCFEKNSGQYYE